MPHFRNFHRLNYSIDEAQDQSSSPNDFAVEESEQEVGMLLPAVQAARESARPSSQSEDPIDDFNAKGFDPQPEPPADEIAVTIDHNHLGTGEEISVTINHDHFGDPASDLNTKGFDPQPEPPADGEMVFTFGDDLEAKGFNPQPEPPADEFSTHGLFGGDGGVGEVDVSMMDDMMMG